MPESRLEYLFNSYIQNSCTSEEEEELMALIALSENQAAVQKLIDAFIENTGSEIKMTDQASASILKNILQKDKSIVIPIEKKRNGFTHWMYAAAIAILFFGATTVFLMLNRKEDKKERVVAVQKNYPIVPGGNRAVLITSDGSTIVLDSIKNGTVIKKGSIKINKKNGLLVYSVSASKKHDVPVAYNTLSTPRGGQYQVILADGTKVWLNAASSLHFPTVFIGNQREVELTGEAYFEVSKNKEKPFLVKVNDMQVKVLGTHFNINAYSGEKAIKTSLLEGSVKIIKGKTSGILKPGQQAKLSSNEDQVEIADANMEEVMAWKNGLFQFEGADITTIMRQIGRWYNVEIIYAGKIPTRQFEGKISRNAQLSDVLRILELSNVKFTVVGNKIIVQ